MQRWRWVLLLGVVVFANCGTSVDAGSFTSIVAFGDSLTDTGNAYIGTGGTIPASPPYELGTFSNGPNWRTYFSSLRGLTPPVPGILPGGNNYAVGGAESGTGLTAGISPNLLTQIGIYLGDTGGVADPNALYTIWAGSFDFLNGQTNPAIPATNVATAVSLLASFGATQFLVLNLPPLGSAPRSLLTLTPEEQQALNALAAQNNSVLHGLLGNVRTTTGATIHEVNIFALYERMQANPAAYGFTNVTSAALLDGVPATGYLFFDDVHPTTAGHALIASTVNGAIPEPSTIVLALIGTVVLAQRQIRRRRAA